MAVSIGAIDGVQPASKANTLVKTPCFQQRERSHQMIVQRPGFVGTFYCASSLQKGTESLEVTAPRLPRLEDQRLSQGGALSGNPASRVLNFRRKDDRPVFPRQNGSEDFAVCVKEHSFTGPVRLPVI